jgi:Tol biopolymer transport system component
MPKTGFFSGAGQFTVSRSGHLVYAGGGATYPHPPSTLMRVAPDGGAERLEADVLGYLYYLRVSPDWKRLAYYTSVSSRLDLGLFVLDLDRRVSRRLNTGISIDPEWSPDGQFLAFTFPREDGVFNIYRMLADGSGTPEPVAPSGREQSMASWSRDGVIAYLQDDDIWVLPPGGEPARFFTSPATERYATFSPDGRWLAYASEDGGRQDVYIRPYPGPDPPTQVSNAGGRAPIWSRDGRRLFYLEQAEGPPQRWRMMRVGIAWEPELQVSRPVPFIDPWPYTRTIPVRTTDILPGDTFLVSLPSRESPSRVQNRVAELHVILNWAADLMQRLPK